MCCAKTKEARRVATDKESMWAAQRSAVIIDRVTYVQDSGVTNHHAPPFEDVVALAISPSSGHPWEGCR